jgi:hypothetical protein
LFFLPTCICNIFCCIISASDSNYDCFGCIFFKFSDHLCVFLVSCDTKLNVDSRRHVSRDIV